MYRASLIAFLSLCLSVGLVAKEPTGELEAIAVNIMTKAFQVADYDTVETLFGKLSPENKVKFLQEAVTLLSNYFNPSISIANLSKEEINQFGETRAKKTQLLGRLTLSLFESATVRLTLNPHHQYLRRVEVMQPTPLIVYELDNHSAPPVANPTPYQTHGGYTVHLTPPPVQQQPIVAPPGHDDGFITLGPYGRVYIKGLNAGEIIDAVNFHLSRFVEQPRVAARHSLSVEMRSLDDAHSDEQIDGEWWRGSVPLNIFR